MSDHSTGNRAGEQLISELGNLPSAERLAREKDIVAGLFDADYYLDVNPSVAEAQVDPLEHFCRYGWRELRRPSPGFDVWWYWANHLDPSDESLNPLVHYALVGRELGLSPRPTSTRARPSQPLPTDRPVRRACLFAAFDADGIIDESVLILLRDLARFSEVFFLADGYLPPEELAKLDGVVTGAWAIRHGAYDFGSYSLLARDLVGWERLATYDEVLLVNDSCFPVRPLDEVFAEMSARACDWWGLQATKGLASTRHQATNAFTVPVPLERVRDELLDVFEDDPVYDFHVGSYFLALRRPVLDDERFRRLIDSVHPQDSKLAVILKYEIGLSHFLIGNGYAFDTFVPALLPFHPLFTETHFDLIADGFPLLKRYLIYQNHYDVPGLAQWKERLLAVAPGAPVDVFEETLLRTSPDDRLRRSLAIVRDERGDVRVPQAEHPRVFAKRDRTAAKDRATWVFAVDPDLHTLPENSRAIFEAVKDDDAIRKVVLTRTRRVDVSGRNTVIEPLTSPAGRELLRSAGVVLVDRQPRRTLGVNASPELRTVVAVRGGLQLERSGHATAAPTRSDHTPPELDRPLPMFHPLMEPTFTALLTASDADHLAALASHWPARYSTGWRTGIPAHDLLQCPGDELPPDLREQEVRLRAALGGRRLLLFQATRRRTGTDRAPCEFSPEEVKHLAAWAERNEAVIGVREPDRDLERPYSRQLLGGLGSSGLDLSHVRLPSTTVALRACDALLTDYSGAALDLLTTGTPAISFAHDLEVARDRLFYDLDHAFPGPVCRDFDQLEVALDGVFSWGHSERHRAARVRDLFLQFDDGRNTARVVERIRVSTEEGVA